MIVCSCNVLSEADIRSACAGGEGAPRRPREVYGCLGCSPQCGRCARTIKRIMTEALVPVERCDLVDGVDADPDCPRR